ncbi:hypothetical protein BDW74DRAFT_14446 [Aspergillus multicolor]|uniref:glycine decarboxylase subunit T n=1 Tax=Aspergillus multicolor TaxID=41759 RepID=UPI003CCCD1E7
MMSSVRSLRQGARLLGARSIAQRAPAGVNGALTVPQLASPHARAALRSPAFGCPVASTLPIANGVRYASSATPRGTLNQTALYDLHIAKGAKMVPFAGYSMPLQYSDLSHVESHKWTREKASLFDVSHMVQHTLSGPGALDLLMKVTPSSLDKLPNNSSTLSCLLEPGTGGIVDDTVITRLSKDTFYFVTNAGRRDEDLAFLTAEIDTFKAVHGAEKEITWEILSNYSLIALQGPEAAAALQPLVQSGADSDLGTLYFGNCRSLPLTLPDGTTTAEPLLISRTGYTGEDGFEISIPHSVSPSAVTELLLQNPSVRLAGLAARDSLRLEAGMCLYGHDISTTNTPPSAALGWIVGKDRRDPSASSERSQFNGAATILPQLASPSKNLSQRRVGFTIEKGSPAREGAVIVDLNDESKTQIGVITSGLPSPSLDGTNIAMGYIKQGLHKKGTEVGVLVRNKLRKATVVGMPWVESKFYRKPSA